MDLGVRNISLLGFFGERGFLRAARNGVRTLVSNWVEFQSLVQFHCNHGLGGEEKKKKRRKGTRLPRSCKSSPM